MNWAGRQAWLRSAARWAPRQSAPWRLRCWLASPIGWSLYRPITLEGLLQFVVVWREAGRSPDCVFHDAPRGQRVEIPIPIEDVNIAGRLIACASNGWPAPRHAESLRYRRKRADAEAYGVSKLVISGGWSKTLNIPCPTLVTPYMDFYVRGDRALLEQLLAEPSCRGIGSDIGKGLGAIVGWEISEDADDRSLVFDGAPQRVLPEVHHGPFAIEGFKPGTWTRQRMNTRAPYWVPGDETMCVVPRVEIET